MGELILSGIVFDMDGVLVDTERMGQAIWREAGAMMNCPGPAENYTHFIGRSWPDSQREMIRLFGEDFPIEEFYRNCHLVANRRLAEEGVPMKPGVFELLDFLKERNIPLGVATSTLRDRAMKRLESAGLLPYFRTVTTGDQVEHSKPDPEIYRKACRSLGLDPATAMAVEDSRNGILSSHGAGMMAVMVPDMIPCTPDLEALLFRKFDSLLELRDFLADVL